MRVAEHEALVVPFPPALPQSRFIIVRELFERVTHLFVGQLAGKSVAALNLFFKVDTFVFHGHRLRVVRDSSHARPANVVVWPWVPTGAGK